MQQLIIRCQDGYRGKRKSSASGCIAEKIKCYWVYIAVHSQLLRFIPNDRSLAEPVVNLPSTLAVVMSHDGGKRDKTDDGRNEERMTPRYHGMIIFCCRLRLCFMNIFQFFQ